MSGQQVREAVDKSRQLTRGAGCARVSSEKGTER